MIFSSSLQWAIYGNYPSAVALVGMSIVLVAGLYGVVCSALTVMTMKADKVQIYGPVDEIQEGDTHVESETSPLLPGGEE